MTNFSRITLFAAALMVSGAALAAAPAAPPAAAPAAAAPKAAPPMVVKDTGLAGSQSIRYDLFYDRYVVSNSGGYVSTLTGDGKLDQLKFVENGKNGAEIANPTGIYVRNGVLYVADAAKGIRVFDLTNGKQTAKYDIPGAIALSSVAVTADNIIFVTDSGKTAADGAIYKIDSTGKVTKIASGASTKRPAGIDVNINRLDKPGGTSTVTYVSADASDIVTIDQTGKEIDRKDLKIGKLNGVLYTDNGNILVDAQDGTIYLLDPYGKPGKLFDGITGAAGIGWDWVRNKTLVAQPSAGVVVAQGPKIAGF